MAILHTELPRDLLGHHGEYVLGKHLSEIRNAKYELWFDVHYLPGVPDLDLIIFDEYAGLFLFEVKSMKLDSIQTYNLNEFVLKKDSPKQHPARQVLTGSLKLRDYLKLYHGKKNVPTTIPFIQTAVLWSEITRAEWNARFTDPRIQIQSKGMAFKDDFETYESIIKCLKQIVDSPIHGTRTPPHCRGDHDGVSEFRTAIAPSSNVIEITQGMKDEIARPVAQSKDYGSKYAPPGSFNVSFEGAPGTGKTTILREIGLKHASLGGAVLHICFNKVLAADQRREYQLLKKDVGDYGFIDVFDEWAFYKSLGFSKGISGRASLKTDLVALMQSIPENERVLYDTILIDESQDLVQELFEIVEMVARPNASWFIAYGKGQELYNFSDGGVHPSPWLQEWFKKAERVILKRSFRNSTRAFLLAQSFWENFSDIKLGKEWIQQKLLQKPTPSDQFEFDLGLPRMDNDFKIERLAQGSGRDPSIRSVILSTLEDAKKANRGMDLLIAVAKPLSSDFSAGKSDETSYFSVKSALEELAPVLNLKFHDLVPQEQRRELTQLGAIRIANHQGIRGLSASHVLIFDLDQLEKWCDKPGNTTYPPIKNLGYVSLSRSKASTILAFNGNPDASIESYLEESLSFIREKSLLPEL